MQTGTTNTELILNRALAIIIIAGIGLRLAAYIDNRCLWTDEVAVALNIAEKNFAQLAQPLNYKQYAPPVFLWMAKASSLLFGMGEQAFRLFPLLTGITALFMFNKVLRQHMSVKTAWYPLLIFATGIFFIRYSTELKQYMPDALVTLVLIWLAKRTDINKVAANKFSAIWITAGSIAIWTSMPSVFVLAGVGFYYAAISIRQKTYRLLPMLAIIATIWTGQFALYYFSILSTQINSDYLVGYHSRFFLDFPYKSTDATRDIDIINTILKNAMDGQYHLFTVNKTLVFIGVVIILTKRTTDSLLLITPVLLMLLAAILKQYSLIPRLTLFIMPLLLLYAGVALEQAMRNKLTAIVTTTALLVLFALNKPFVVLAQPIREEQITEALDYITEKGIKSEQLYVYTGAIESFRYYTTIHPSKNKWQDIREAHMLMEGNNTDSIARHLPAKAALLYTIPFDNFHTQRIFEQYAVASEKMQSTGCTVILFSKKG